MNHDNSIRPLIIFFMLSLLFALLIALPSILENFGFIDAEIPLLPLWFAGLGWENMSFAVFTWNCIAMAVILTWICNNTRGNMVLVTLFHMFYNYGFGLMNDVWNVPPEKGIIYLAGVLTVYVAVVIVIYGPGKLSRKETLPAL